MIRELTLADEKFLTQVTAAAPRQIRSYLEQGAAHQHARSCEPHRSAQEHFGALSVESAD